MMPKKTKTKTKPVYREAFSFEEFFEAAKRRTGYWLERIELCENKAQRRSLAKEIAELAQKSIDIGKRTPEKGQL